MRISDWSSDVCSSDLLLDLVAAEHRLCQLLRGIEYQRAAGMRAAAATENHGFGQFLCARQFLRHVAESLVETGDVLIRGLGFVELALALEIKRKVVDQIEQDRKSRRLNSSH